MKKEFYYLSADEKTQIHAIEWMPEEPPRAVLQLCHGMAEYIARYDDFGEFLSLNGYYVVGHDHLGHGESITGTDQLGFFHEKKGNEYVVDNCNFLICYIERHYGGAYRTFTYARRKKKEIFNISPRPIED